MGEWLELADTPDSKSGGANASWGFKSPLPYQLRGLDAPNWLR